LSDVVSNAEPQWEESEWECQEWVHELTLLQTRAFELCQAIVCPPRVRSYLSEGIQITALRHTKMTE
jgi:hypothetical protein